jgi:hypothetical protein
MVFNATFNNISVTSWRSVLLVEETGVPGDVVSGTPRLSGIRTHNFSGDMNGLSSIFTKKKAPKNYSNYEEFSQRTFNIGNFKNWDLFY